MPVIVDKALNVAGFVVKVIQRVRRAVRYSFGQNPCAVKHVVVGRVADGLGHRGVSHLMCNYNFEKEPS